MCGSLRSVLEAKHLKRSKTKLSGWLSGMQNKLSTGAEQSVGMVGDQTLHLGLGFLSPYLK